MSVTPSARSLGIWSVETESRPLNFPFSSLLLVNLVKREKGRKVRLLQLGQELLPIPYSLSSAFKFCELKKVGKCLSIPWGSKVPFRVFHRYDAFPGLTRVR